MQVNGHFNQMALVTGAARRIGAAIVQQLHQAGYKVIIHCHQSVNEANQLCTKLNEQREGSAVVVQKDLFSPTAVDDLVSVVAEQQEELGLLVHNASQFIRDSKDNEVNHIIKMKLFNLHVTVPYDLSLALAPFLQRANASIINISDIHALHPLAGYSIYSESKAALNEQTKYLARSLAPKVRVNAIAPGAIIWPEGDNTLSLAAQQRIKNKSLLKKTGSPVNIAQAVLMMAENNYITGQILAVDGGRSLR